MYDSCPAGMEGHYLGVLDAVSLAYEPEIHVVKEFGFRSADHCTRTFLNLAEEVSAEGILRAGVVVQTPYSVAVVLVPPHRFILFDSHAHGDLGALIVHGSSGEDFAKVLAESVGELRDSHFCLLQLSS